MKAFILPYDSGIHSFVKSIMRRNGRNGFEYHFVIKGLFLCKILFYTEKSKQTEKIKGTQEEKRLRAGQSP